MTKYCKNIYLTIIRRAQTGSQSMAHEAEHSPEYTAFYIGALLTGIICEYRDYREYREKCIFTDFIQQSAQTQNLTIQIPETLLQALLFMLVC